MARVKRYESGVLRDPVVITPEHTVLQVMQLSEELGISGFPVLDGGKVVGIVTGRDLRFETRYDVKVRDIMTPRDRLVWVRESATLEEGKALTPGGEVVTLRPRAESPQLFDAQTLYRVPGEAPARSEAALSTAPAPQNDEPSTVGGGPAQVSTQAYREGWGAIFGGARRRRGSSTLN